MTLLGIIPSKTARPRHFPLQQRVGIRAGGDECLSGSEPDQRSASRSTHGQVMPPKAQWKAFIVPIHGSFDLHSCRRTLAEGWSSSPACESGCPDAIPLLLGTGVDADRARCPVSL